MLRTVHMHTLGRSKTSCWGSCVMAAIICHKRAIKGNLVTKVSKSRYCHQHLSTSRPQHPPPKKTKLVTAPQTFLMHHFSTKGGLDYCQHFSLIVYASIGGEHLVVPLANVYDCVAGHFTIGRKKKRRGDFLSYDEVSECHVTNR